jgi:23S rRNA pseudouridine1911/1915/1917 synthase
MEQRYSDDELELLSNSPDVDFSDEGDEMYEHFSVVVDKGQSMMRLDKFLTQRMEHTSRNRIQAAADSRNILVNGVAQKSSYKVKPLDKISIVLPYPRRESEIIPENIPLDIVYEDADLLVVNKPKGMVVHPAPGHSDGTLVNALLFHCADSAYGLQPVLPVRSALSVGLLRTRREQ